MRKKLLVSFVLTMLLFVVVSPIGVPVGEGKLGGSLELTTTYGRATTVVAGWRAFLDIYGDIITFVNESVSATEWTLMYYNISTGAVINTGVSVHEDPYLLWHSIYDNLIASPGPYGDYGIGLYNLSVGSVTKLPYPYLNDLYDVITWATVFPSNIISIYGDIITLCDHDGVWVYNITTSSIIANLTTGPPANRWGVSVYENLIAFSDDFIWYYNISTNTKTNTTVPGRMPSLYGDIIAFVDCDFQSIRYYNISSGQVSTIESPLQPEEGGGMYQRPSIYGDVIVFSIYETMIDGGTDVNGDGDMSDWVVRYYNLSTHMLVNTREIGAYSSIYGNTIVFQTYEPWVDTDLNEDGDKDDYVIRYVYLARAPTVYVDPPAIITPPSRNFTISVKIANVTNLYGVDIQLRWDTNLIEYVNHTVHIPVEEYPDGVLYEPVMKLKDVVDEEDAIPGAEPGTIYWLAYSSLTPAASFNGSGTIFEMTFHCRSEGVSTLDFCSTQCLWSKSAEEIPHELEEGLIIQLSDFLIVVGDQTDSHLNLFTYQGTGLQTLVDSVPSPDGSDLEIFDADNDCDLDFVAAVGEDEAIRLYLYINEGAGDFTRVEIPNTMMWTGIEWGHVDIGCGDFTNDGKIDFVVTSGGDRTTRIYLFINQGELSFEQQGEALQAHWATHAWGIDTEDFNEDGNLDFVMFDYPYEGNFQDDVYVYYGDGGGDFTKNLAIQTQHSVSHVTAADFDNDGHSDILIGKDDDGDPGQTWLYRGNGDGTFQAAVESFDLDPIHEDGGPHNEGCGGMDAYDADKDGNVDVIACASGLGKVCFLKGDGTGTDFVDSVIDDTLIYPVAVAVVRRIEHDVAITGLTMSRRPFRTVDDYLWATDAITPDGLDYANMSGTTTAPAGMAAFGGDGEPYWTGNFSTSCPFVSINNVTANFVGNDSSRVLSEGVDYKVHTADQKIELLVPIDVDIMNEYWVDGVNNTLNGWPVIGHNATGISSVYVKFPNGTERDSPGGLGCFEEEPPCEWWYGPDCPNELQGWWVLGYVYPGVDPGWPFGSEWWVNYTAVSYLTVDYNASRRPGPFVEIGETIDIYVTVENQGNIAEVFDFNLYYILDFDPLIGTQTVTLKPGAFTIFWFTFTPNMYEAYQILAEAETVPCEQDTDDNTRVIYVHCMDPAALAPGAGGGPGGNPWRNTFC